MQQRRAGQPRHQRLVLHRIPKPKSAPAELVVSPVGAHSDANGQEYPRCKRPWAHPTRPGSINAAFDERSNREGKGNRESDIAQIEKRWVNGETDILQDRIKVAPFERSLWQAQERIGGDENE